MILQVRKDKKSYHFHLFKIKMPVNTSCSVNMVWWRPHFGYETINFVIAGPHGKIHLAVTSCFIPGQCNLHLLDTA